MKTFLHLKNDKNMALTHGLHCHSQKYLSTYQQLVAPLVFLFFWGNEGNCYYSLLIRVIYFDTNNIETFYIKYY